MVPKLDKEVRRLQMVVPAPWLKKIDDWRARQRPVPNVSAAIRRLVEIGLEAERKGK